ncbi:hypothetical protein RJZ56_006810 [Blastomyces dermatitidis]|uniref:Uncharacterized protein n=2 Tax=Ajellomyces dermatitidis TaxID=5039 RepID=F2TKY8_AJEDA|nr:hypothetical protein, variant 1 [Blastomyces dermatitidis ER-3]XP_045281311.1 uncharacterized protein BDCG_05574 [Blastomyces dermatitidis ER-3]XP_045281312.1 hypothetical protein, variant 2 [Blastomyces dermatitidis ER-3]XP_045281313.1 hypothetical protein, variant 3 [Blastomyces dermatitidis ER-3]EGE83901.1 hypothetical protein BDDG_06846 [Blastomyces dermatitidis ATCC 18188]EEQ90454.1 hypothetical protein, variant 1 [Blastomyces dermatitidis ER-3]KMW68233.1 hypothetical protein, variant
MTDFAVWSPIVSFLTLIQYINGFAGAAGEMRTADDIINCTSDLLIGVKYDFENFRNYLPSSRRRYTERQIDRTDKELKKAQQIIAGSKDKNAAKRRINDICWVLKTKAELQTCLTALRLYHITLSQIRSELAFLESTIPWTSNRLCLELRTFSNPRLGPPVDMNKEPRVLTWAEGERSNGSQHSLPTSQPRHRFLTMSSLPYADDRFAISPRYSDPEDLGLWLLQQRCDVDRVRD